MKKIIRYLCFLILGVHMGYGLHNWETWSVLFLVIIIGITGINHD